MEVGSRVSLDKEVRLCLLLFLQLVTPLWQVGLPTLCKYDEHFSFLGEHQLGALGREVELPSVYAVTETTSTGS